MVKSAPDIAGHPFDPGHSTALRRSPVCRHRKPSVPRRLHYLGAKPACSAENRDTHPISPTTSTLSLLGPQCFDRLDAGRTVTGDSAGDQSDGREQQGDRDEGQRISRANAIDELR